MNEQIIEPIVIEFISSNFPYENAKHYYIGKSKEDILDSTNNGKYDYLAKFSFYKEISLKEARQFNLGFYIEGHKAVLNGAKTFKLKTPDNMERIFLRNKKAYQIKK